MGQSYAVEFRPQVFGDILGQVSVIKTLERQLETGNISHCYLFCGPSGDGKTTIARAFGKRINKGKGQPFEIDAASCRGIGSKDGDTEKSGYGVRDIIREAEQRAIDAEYKIFIIDECHALTGNAWQAFLKTIEEPPEYSIFMFCTTNPEAIPATILNRVMRFNLTKVDTNLIRERLEYVCQQKNLLNYQEACDYIAKLSDGGVRDAIAALEKCANYNPDLSIQNVLDCLGIIDYKVLFDLTNAFIDSDEGLILKIIEDFYNSGKDLKTILNFYIEFVLDLLKYCLFNNMSSIKIPQSLENQIKYAINFDNNTKFYNMLVNKLLEVKFAIKDDPNAKTTIEIMFIAICRG